VAAAAAGSFAAAQQEESDMNQSEKAARFAELHVKGAPLLLYNAWDAGSAKSILDAGAKAIATSSCDPAWKIDPGGGVIGVQL
jgi:hypothetical protein